MSDILEDLKDYMAKNNINQSNLSYILRVTCPQMSRWMTGRGKIGKLREDMIRQKLKI